MSLPFKIAARFLSTSKKQTVFIALAVAIGVSVQVFIGALITGLQSSLVDRTIGNSSQVTVTSTLPTEQIGEWEGLIDDIKANVSGIKHCSANIDSGAFFVNKDNKTISTLVRGFDARYDAIAIYGFDDYIYEGRYPSADYEVMIGRELRNELGYGVGEEIELLKPAGQAQPVPYNVTITGLFDVGVASVNALWVVTSRETADAIFEFGGNVSKLEFQLFDVFASDEVAASINETYGLAGLNLTITDWKAQNQQLLSGLRGQTISSVFIQAFVLISVVLGISSVLAITVLQKNKQLGIMKAMGIKDKDASAIFLSEGAILGFIGGTGGIALGIGLLLAFTTFATNPDGTPIIDVVIDPAFILISGLLAIISATIAAAIPAARSARLNPIEVIRE